MKENRTDNKLDTELVPTKISNSGTQKFRLKFTDFAIEKYTHFGVPSSIFILRLMFPNIILKGLKLCQFFKVKEILCP